MKKQIKPENPPAFPMPETQDMHGGYGMTLRDYFAGQALTGLCFGSEISDPDRMALMTSIFGFMSYEIADAMLKARGK